MHLFITFKGQIYKVPNPRNGVFKEVQDLANSSVLYVCLAYEILNRKPFKTVQMWYDRININSNGQYIITDEEIQKKMRNYKNFGFEQIIEAAFDMNIPEIPDAPALPNSVQKEGLRKYFQSKYSVLWKNSWNKFYERESQLNHQHKSMIKTLKQRSRLKGESNLDDKCPF